MDLWYSEFYTKNVKLSIKIEKELITVKSDYQSISVLQSYDFGKILVIDGYIMLTEKDEFIYHEMITHVPMAVHPDAKKILIIGGGDGGTVRELLKYSFVKKIDLVEIDEEVVKISKEYLPFTACGLSDPRVNLIYQDGLKYVRRVENKYDLIIVDSTDPFGPGEGLFTKEFYGNCYKALKDDGILVNQHENPFYEKDAQAVKRTHKRIVESFDYSKLYQAHIPTYPSGHWLFGFVTKKYHPLKDLDVSRWKSLNIETKYYNTNLHLGAFYLPNYVEALVKDVEP